MKKDESGWRERLRVLKQENAALKKRLKQVEAERDGFRRVAHAWAKASISTAQLRQWDREEDDSGQTILDVIAEFE